MEMADLNAVLGEVIAAESGYEREIETALYPGSIEVKMHPLSIKRAVANMVVNAARYGNGWIKVSSGTEPNRARSSEISRVLANSAVLRREIPSYLPSDSAWKNFTKNDTRTVPNFSGITTALSSPPLSGDCRTKRKCSPCPEAYLSTTG